MPVVIALVTVIILLPLFSVLSPRQQEPRIHGIMDIYGTFKELTTEFGI